MAFSYIDSTKKVIYIKIPEPACTDSGFIRLKELKAQQFAPYSL